MDLNKYIQEIKDQLDQYPKSIKKSLYNLITELENYIYLEPELIELAQEEINEKITLINTLMEKKIEPIIDSFFLEIRNGIGGDESCLFAADLFNMYKKYLEFNNIDFDIMYLYENKFFIRSMIMEIKDKNMWKIFQWEKGVHRIQRIPKTETQGRLHTSTATVTVIPKHENIEIKILNKDLRVDTFRASGAGGQHVNTTDSAVRITHIPTGIVASCQDGRSQLKNKEQAMILLKSKLYDYEKQIQNTKISQERQESSLNAERSEKIRTYNEPQGRITDHRCNVTLYKYESILKGNLNELFDEIHKYNLSN